MATNTGPAKVLSNRKFTENSDHMLSCRVLSGLDVPADSLGGSIELFRDLYLGPFAYFAGEFFMMKPLNQTDIPRKIRLVDLDRPTLSGPQFYNYVREMSRRLTGMYANQNFDVLHLHHGAFGASRALLLAFPAVPSLLFIHGTDILCAISNPTQMENLAVIAQDCTKIVVPTSAMRSLLVELLSPDIETKVVVIPWGIPDAVFSRQLPKVRRKLGLRPKLLFAGRLSAEKGLSTVLESTSATKKAEIFVTASKSDLKQVHGEVPTNIHAIGWMQRRHLWTLFDEFDALIVPSESIEAFGLGAIEAQARGLPVFYQPTSGLIETIGVSGAPVNFRGTGLSDFLEMDITRQTELLSVLSRMGKNNSDRFRMSAMLDGLVKVHDSIGV